MGRSVHHVAHLVDRQHRAQERDVLVDREHDHPHVGVPLGHLLHGPQAAARDRQIEEHHVGLEAAGQEWNLEPALGLPDHLHVFL